MARTTAPQSFRRASSNQADALQCAVCWRREHRTNGSDAYASEAVRKVIAIYEAANTRRFHNFNFTWQAVALAVAGEAFLFRTALGPGETSVGRYISSTLAIFIALAGIVLMQSQRRYQRVEAGWLDWIETQYDFPEHLAHAERAPARRWLLDHRVAGGTSRPTLPDNVARPSLCDRVFTQATGWWQALLGLFILAAAAVIVITATKPQWIG